MTDVHDYIKIEHFGADHWSTFAYAETVMVDNNGFQIGFDGRMRQGRGHFRVMQEECPKPRRQNHAGLSSAVVMEKKYSTRLKNGSVVDGHDDWHCVQDLVHAGLLGAKRLHDGLVIPLDEGCEPGNTLYLTPFGAEVASRLRQHKARGGRWIEFSPDAELVEEV